MKGRPRLAKACDHLCDAYIAAINAAGMTWAANSPVAASIDAADPKYAEILEESAIFALLAFESAIDHLRALGQILRTDAVTPLATVTRGTVEAAAASAYLLDLEVPAKERARRFLNHMLASLTDLQLAPDEVADQEGLRRTLEEGIKSGAQLGFSVTRPRRAWEAPYLGERPEHIGARLEKVMSAAGLGKVVYRMLSSTAHATHHGLMHYRTYVPGGSEGYVATEASLNDVSIALRHASAPISVVRAGSRLFHAYDLNTTSVSISEKMALAAWAQTAQLDHDAFAHVSNQ